MSGSPALDRVNFIISNARLVIARGWRRPAVDGAGARDRSRPRGRSACGWRSARWPWSHAKRLAALRARAGRRAASTARVSIGSTDDGPRRGWAGAAATARRFSKAMLYARDLDLFGPASLVRAAEHDAHRDRRGDARRLAPRSRRRCAEVRARQARDRRAAPDARLHARTSPVLASESPVGRTGLLAAWAAIGAGALSRRRCASRWPRARWSPIGAGRRRLSRSCRSGVALHLAVRRNRVRRDLAARRSIRCCTRIDTPERDLGLLAGLLARIESEPLRVAATRPRCSSALLTDGVPPSTRIAQLRRLVSWLDSTHNLMFAPIAFILLLRPQLAIAIDRWQRGARPRGRRLAAGGRRVRGAARRSRPTPTSGRPIRFPSSLDGGPIFEAEALGHPLIAAASRCGTTCGSAAPGRA